MRKIDPAKIALSADICTWSNQFSMQYQSLAKSLVASLDFVSRDDYSKWVLAELKQISQNAKVAIYSVRKLENDLWAQDVIASRPGNSQGSEDLVYSLIANFTRDASVKGFDHPGVDVLRSQKIHDIIFVDDSIGSGERVSQFAKSFLKNKTIRSWWSLGLIKIHVVSFSRMKVGEQRIVAELPGSDHSCRVYPKRQKIFFYSAKVFNADWLESRWGKQHKRAMEFCKSEERLSIFVVLGIGNVMANMVFYHSVPDNIPGIFWSDGDGFTPLFGNRTLPNWAIELLEQPHTLSTENKGQNNSNLNGEMIRLLDLIKRGIRNLASIARGLNCDQRYAKALTSHAVDAGLISTSFRLSPAGKNYLAERKVEVAKHSQTMYIPQSWCAT